MGLRVMESKIDSDLDLFYRLRLEKTGNLKIFPWKMISKLIDK